ncbi:MAG: TraB/VirB10 family protein [Sinobacteraceae bacterium]|nr:TraB/VirB10 family protein [Nevskiaceae bacterium]
MATDEDTDDRDKSIDPKPDNASGPTEKSPSKPARKANTAFGGLFNKRSKKAEKKKPESGGFTPAFRKLFGNEDKNGEDEKPSRSKSSDGGTGGKDAPRKLKVRISPQHQKMAAQKKWLYLLVGGFAVVFLISFLIKGHHAPPPAKKGGTDISLTPKGTLRQDFEASTQSQLLSLKSFRHRAEDHQKQVDTTLQSIRRSQTDIQNTLDTLKSQVASGLAGSVRLPETPALPAPPEPGPPAKSGPSGASSGSSNLGALPPVAPPPSASSTPVASGAARQAPPPRLPSQAPMVFTPEGNDDGSSTGSGKDKTKVGVHSAWHKNSHAGYIPAGSFAPVVLLTGVEAGTATSSQADPQPVLMRIEHPAVLPGSARYKITSCFVLGSASGSMSTERAYIRLARISCIDKARHFVLDEPLKGYLADSDGMFGLRGKLVERRGSLLAKSLLAGFASGLSNALSRAQGTAYQGSFGATTSFSGSQAMKSSLFGGGSQAANLLAKFYLKQAQSIFPVVEVPPRRKATLVLTNGVSLHWSDYGSLYVKSITPEK